MSYLSKWLFMSRCCPIAAFSLLAAVLTYPTLLSAKQLAGIIEASEPPHIYTEAGCASQLHRVTSKETVVIRKIFAKNLHFRGSRHNPIPHWNADYSDIENVFAALTPASIPPIVYLLKDGHLNGGMRSIGAGVLKMFGEKSLPCIDAALRDPSIKGYGILSGVRTSIENIN